MGRFVKTGAYQSIKDQMTGGFRLPAGATAERSGDPSTGELRYNTSTGRVEYYNGSTYKEIAAQGNVTITKDSFTGDGSTVAYTLSTSPADENNVLIFVGNVHQNPDVAFTISGSTLTFSSPPPNTHAIIVFHGFDSTAVS